MSTLLLMLLGKCVCILIHCVDISSSSSSSSSCHDAAPGTVVSFVSPAHAHLARALEAGARGDDGGAPVDAVSPGSAQDAPPPPPLALTFSRRRGLRRRMKREAKQQSVAEP